MKYDHREVFLKTNTIRNIHEIWKDIPDYEGFYQVSDKGRVRSLDRYIDNGKRLRKGKVMNRPTDSDGYARISLYKNGKMKSKRVCRLILESFICINEVLQANHIDSNRYNDNLCNLEWLTPRENVIHSKTKKICTSIFHGVSWSAKNKKWIARATIDGKRKYLGSFSKEKDAFNAVLDASGSNKYHNDNKLCDNIKRMANVGIFKSKYIGVSFDDNHGKWIAYIGKGNKIIRLGSFDTEIEAYEARLSGEEYYSKNTNVEKYFNDIKNKKTSKYKGVYFDKSWGKWRAVITINSKKVNIGGFESEQKAYQALLKYKSSYS